MGTLLVADEKRLDTDGGDLSFFHFSLNHCGNYVPSGGSVEYFLFPLMNKGPWKSCRENSNHSQISVLYGTRADSWIDPICVGNLDCVISLHFRKNRKVLIQNNGETDKKITCSWYQLLQSFKALAMKLSCF